MNVVLADVGNYAKQAQGPCSVNSDRPLVGRSSVMHALRARIEKVARSEATVLITGETGTGKESIARAIHDNGPRRDGPYVAVNCAAIPESLFSSEFFGFVKGAFTGASQGRTGRVGSAEGGTLFLDEVGDLSDTAQVQLLRLLQERAYEPLGSNHRHHANVRFLAATHRNLRTMVGQGKFREDLFYRLAVLLISAPPLRERVEDIPLLVDHFCRRYATQHPLPFTEVQFSDRALALLGKQPWAGNVRQLESLVVRMLVLSESAHIDVDDVLRELSGTSFVDESTDRMPLVASSELSLAASTLSAERDAIHSALTRAEGNRSAAARLLGVSRQTLYNKMCRVGMMGPTRR